MRKLIILLIVAVGATLVFPGDAHALFGKKRRAARSGGEQTGNPYITGSGNITAPVLPPELASGGPEQCVRGPDGRCLNHAQAPPQYQPAQPPDYYQAGPAPTSPQPYYVETPGLQLTQSSVDPVDAALQASAAAEAEANARKLGVLQATKAAERKLAQETIALEAVDQSTRATIRNRSEDLQERLMYLQDINQAYAPQRDPGPAPQGPPPLLPQ